jgi:hypothetical protein
VGARSSAPGEEPADDSNGGPHLVLARLPAGSRRRFSACARPWACFAARAALHAAGACVLRDSWARTTARRRAPYQARARARSRIRHHLTGRPSLSAPFALAGSAAPLCHTLPSQRGVSDCPTPSGDWRALAPFFLLRTDHSVSADGSFNSELFCIPPPPILLLSHAGYASIFFHRYADPKDNSLRSTSLREPPCTI